MKLRKIYKFQFLTARLGGSLLSPIFVRKLLRTGSENQRRTALSYFENNKHSSFDSGIWSRTGFCAYHIKLKYTIKSAFAICQISQASTAVCPFYTTFRDIYDFYINRRSTKYNRVVIGEVPISSLQICFISSSKKSTQ